MNKHTLIICFNRFNAAAEHTYLESITRPDGSCEINHLKRKPRSARFDEVLETGEGSYNPWNAHKAVKLRHHELLKR